MNKAEEIKKGLLNICYKQIDQRIENARQAMNAAQESANAEEKSSAGDKYETGRAMAQIERDKAAQQLNEAIVLKNSLSRVNVKPAGGRVSLGSLILTDKNHFFLAISVGKLRVDHIDYFVVAPSTPIGRILSELQVGSQFLFNNQLQTIREIL